MKAEVSPQPRIKLARVVLPTRDGTTYISSQRPLSLQHQASRIRILNSIAKRNYWMRKQDHQGSNAGSRVPEICAWQTLASTTVF